MRKLLDNPLMGRVRGGWPGNPRQAVLAAILAGLLLLVPWFLGVCACTMFEIGALLLVLTAALRGGNTVYGAITGERERKTLDSLRLTQLTSGQVVLGKISGELKSLAWLLVSAAPALLALTVLGGIPLESFVSSLAVAAVAGLFASTSGLLASSLAPSTSQAVLSGWVFKGIWLVCTPLCDLVARAVLVADHTPVFFTAANPLAAVALATVPEAAFGAFGWLVPVNLGFLFLASLAMLHLAAMRLAGDPSVASEIAEGKVHRAWMTGWGPSWLQALLPGLSRNASFLREVASQARTGAFWPGLAIWLVLFLAPFLYARAWSVQNSQSLAPVPVPCVMVSARAPAGLPPPSLDVAGQAGAQAVYATAPGQQTVLVFRGHRPETCFRLALYQAFGVPMPRGTVQAVVPVGPSRGPGREVQVRPLDQMDPQTLGDFAMAPPPAPPPPDFGHQPGYLDAVGFEGSADRALQVGLLGTMVLFLLNLSLRCAGLLAGTLTGERDRRTWQDLALTGMPARQVVFGKLWGGLFYPLLEMTVVFPVLLIYVAAGVLDLAGLGALYVYAVGLALTAGLLGLWSSARSRTTHTSQGLAVGLALLAFVLGLLTWAEHLVVIPVALALFGAGRAASRANPSWKAWLLMGLGLGLAPQALSPLAAVVGFTPALGRIIGLSGGAAAQSGLPALAHFVGAMLFLAGASLFFVRGVLDRVEDPARGGGLQVEPD